MSIKGIMYARSKKFVEYLQVTEENYEDCLIFITNCNAQVKQFTERYEKKIENFKKEGIYFYNAHGKLSRCNQGNYLVRHYDDLTVMDVISLNHNYSDVNSDYVNEILGEDSYWLKNTIK